MKPGPDSMVVLVSRLGRVGAAFPRPQITVPKTWIEGDGLHWSRKNESAVAADDERMLVDFVALADRQDPQRILEYATRFGPLWLCAKHGQPVMHRHKQRPCIPRYWWEGGVLEYAEPLSGWWNYSRRARAILALSAALAAGEEGDAADWRLVLGGAPLPARDSTPLEARLRSLSYAVNQWLNAAPVNPVLLVLNGRLRFTFVPETSLLGVRRMWSETDSTLGGPPKKKYPRIALLAHAAQDAVNSSGADSLFAALAVQLALTVSGGAGFAYCSACGKPYRPDRAPAQDRLHFCKECGAKASRRLSKRRSRHTGEEGQDRVSSTSHEENRHAAQT